MPVPSSTESQVQNTTYTNLPPRKSNNALLLIAGLFAVIVFLIGGIFLFDFIKPQSNQSVNSVSPTPMPKPVVDSKNIMDQAVNYAQASLKPSYPIITSYASPAAESKIFDGKIFIRKNAVKDAQFSQLSYTIGQPEAYWGSFVAIQETGLANNDLSTFLSFFNKYFNVPEVAETEWKQSVNKSGNKQYEVVTDNADGSYNSISGYAIPEPNKNTFSIIGLACHKVPASPDFQRHSCVFD